MEENKSIATETKEDAGESLKGAANVVFYIELIAFICLMIFGKNKMGFIAIAIGVVGIALSYLTFSLCNAIAQIATNSIKNREKDN